MRENEKYVTGVLKRKLMHSQDPDESGISSKGTSNSSQFSTFLKYLTWEQETQPINNNVPKPYLAESNEAYKRPEFYSSSKEVNQLFMETPPYNRSPTIPCTQQCVEVGWYHTPRSFRLINPRSPHDETPKWKNNFFNRETKQEVPLAAKDEVMDDIISFGALMRSEKREILLRAEETTTVLAATAPIRPQSLPKDNFLDTSVYDFFDDAVPEEMTQKCIQATESWKWKRLSKAAPTRTATFSKNSSFSRLNSEKVSVRSPESVSKRPGFIHRTRSSPSLPRSAPKKELELSSTAKTYTFFKQQEKPKKLELSPRSAKRHKKQILRWKRIQARTRMRTVIRLEKKFAKELEKLRTKGKKSRSGAKKSFY